MRLQSTIPLLLALLAACPSPQGEPGDDSTSEGTTDADTTPTGDDTNTGDECDGPDGCYACAPEEPTQLLNACSDAQCEPFANTRERLPLLVDGGKLPPLP